MLAHQSAGSGSSYIAAYSASSSLLPEASVRASLMPSGLDASSAASASSRIVSGSTPTSSAAASFFGSSLISSAAACRRSSFLSVGGPLLSAVVVLGDGFDVLGDLGSYGLLHPFRPLLVHRIGEDGFDLLVARVHAQHRVGHTVSVLSSVSSRRLARIQPLRPMCEAVRGVLPERFRMRSIAASSCSRMPASWFVMGGSRPAWGSFGMVVSRRVGVFRRARRRWGRSRPPTAPTPRPAIVLDRGRSGAPHLRSCGVDLHDSDRLCAGRVSCWMSAPEAARRACSARLPVVLLKSLKCGRWMAFGPSAGAGRIVDDGRSSSSSSPPAWFRSWSLARFFDCVRGAVLSPADICRSLAGRPSGERRGGVGCSSGVNPALRLGGVFDGRTARRVVGTRCVGSGFSRPSRRSVALGS